MAGEKSLTFLLENMSPKLLKPRYVFCTLPHAQYGYLKEASPIASFMEAEGLTLVIEQTAAEEFKLSYEGVFKCISLSVHSSLDAVGLTASISSALSKQQISANIIAAYHHDHIFVNQQLAQEALEIIQELSLSNHG